MLGKRGGSVSYDYLLPAERGVCSRLCVLHQVKMRMRGGWPLYVKQKRQRKKGDQFEQIISELQGLDQTALCGYRDEITIRENISIDLAKQIARDTLVAPYPRGTVAFQEVRNYK